MNNYYLIGKEIKTTVILFCVLLFSTSMVFGQEDFICGTEYDATTYPPGTFSHSNDPLDLEEFDPVVLNIHFWQISDPNWGFGGKDELSEHLVLEVIQYLNVEFNPYKIFFKYTGFTKVNSPSNVPYTIIENGVCVDQFNQSTNPPTPLFDPEGFSNLSYKCEKSDFVNFIVTNDYQKADALDIYVPYKITEVGAYAEGLFRSTVPVGSLLKGHFIHEIGHNLGLHHPFYNWYNDEYTLNTPGPHDPEYDACEHVNRQIGTYGYNADNHGDQVHATAAVPNFIVEHCFFTGLPFSQCYGENSYRYQYINADCEYTGQNFDCLDDFYDIYLEDTTNYMAYIPTLCRYQFTIEQGMKMRETIENNGGYNPIKTPIASLYEPYAGEYYLSGPGETQPPLFQPGFDYRFVSCSCDNILSLDCSLPCEWEDTSFQNNYTVITLINKLEDDFSTITHPNHTAIYIDQLSDYEERRCYDNWNAGAIGGFITKFEDEVFNTNVTITPKDSIGINNQNLIIDLPQGLYRIEKNYNDGTSQERVIFKENNN